MTQMKWWKWAIRIDFSYSDRGPRMPCAQILHKKKKIRQKNSMNVILCEQNCETNNKLHEIFKAHKTLFK